MHSFAALSDAQYIASRSAVEALSRESLSPPQLILTLNYHRIQDSDTSEYTLETIRAPATLLATGGLGDLYAHTSNPASAKGAGFAMALRAGASLSSMEYVQFHPTTLYLPGERSFLLSEALRGEGARLVDRGGRAFAKNYHPAAEVRAVTVTGRGDSSSRVDSLGSTGISVQKRFRFPRYFPVILCSPAGCRFLGEIICQRRL